MSKNSETTWKSQSGFIWSLIGSAVGFANILSFSAKAYKNGGGAFLIPYVIALCVLGIPLLILEGLIGSTWKAPLTAAYGVVKGKIGKIFGWLSVLSCLTIGSFYIVLTGYSVAYTYFSATCAIGEDTKSFFLDNFLQLSSGITDFGSFSKMIFFSTLAVSVITYFVLARNVRDGIEKICSIFMPMIAVIVTIFAVVVTFLPGGIDGWYYYLKPDFSKLLDPKLWVDVFGQLFFSLSLGLGIVVGYSRHAEKGTNIAKAMMYVAVGDFAVSFVAGAAIFGCLAHIAHVQQIPFESILTTDSTFQIGFVIFPKILKFFGPILSQLMGVLFFFCIFIAGITGVFSIVESIAGNVEVEFSMKRKRAVLITVAALMSIATIFCMGNASYIIDALVPMVLGTNMLIGTIAAIFAFYYSSEIIQNDSSWVKGDSLTFSGFCIRYIAPSLLLIILSANLYGECTLLDVTVAIRWLWFAISLTLAYLFSSMAEDNKRELVHT